MFSCQGLLIELTCSFLINPHVQLIRLHLTTYSHVINLHLRLNIHRIPRASPKPRYCSSWLINLSDTSIYTFTPLGGKVHVEIRLSYSYSSQCSAPSSTMISMVHGINRFHAKLSTGLQVYSSGLPSAKAKKSQNVQINQSIPFP